MWTNQKSHCFFINRWVISKLFQCVAYQMSSIPLWVISVSLSLSFIYGLIISLFSFFGCRLMAAPKCSVKPVSKVDNYNKKTQCYSRVETFWPVQHDEISIDKINKLNWRNKAISISTYNFSILYTNIPHHKVKSVRRELINFCFNVGNKEIIVTNRHGASWID